MFVEEKTQGEVSEAPAKVLKLSEAIRIGAKIRPQAFDWSSDASCVLMAGYEGIHGCMPKNWSVVNKFVDVFLGIPTEITGEAMRLNDDERMPREKIADWLESRGY